MMKKQAAFVLHAKDRIELEGMLRDGNVPQKIVKRAKIVLMTADGAGVMAIMRAVGVSKTTVWRWQDYFVEAGVVGLVKGRSKPPGKEPIADAVKLKIVEKTVKERPANATHWSVRMRHQPYQRAAHLEGTWAQTPPRSYLQGLQRSGLRQEGGGHRRPLSQSTG